MVLQWEHPLVVRKVVLRVLQWADWMVLHSVHPDGCIDGCPDGSAEGSLDGCVDGCSEGSPVGCPDGSAEG